MVGFGYSQHLVKVRQRLWSGLREKKYDSYIRHIYSIYFETELWSFPNFNLSAYLCVNLKAHGTLESGYQLFLLSLLILWSITALHRG